MDTVTKIRELIDDVCSEYTSAQMCELSSNVDIEMARVAGRYIPKLNKTILALCDVVDAAKGSELVEYHSDDCDAYRSRLSEWQPVTDECRCGYVKIKDALSALDQKVREVE